MTATHTPLPWTLHMIERHECGPLVPEVRGADGSTVCDAQTYYPHPVSLPDAALIVERVNGWDALKAERDALKAALVQIRDLDYRGNRHESAGIAFAVLGGVQ